MAISLGGRQREPQLSGYIPEQGDIVWLDFNPSSGIEIIKRRPAFVISQQLFNGHTHLAVVAPITSTIRGIQLEVVLPESLSIRGSVLVHQLKSLDFQARNLRLIEKAPQEIIEKVTERARLIVS
ncbi:MAG: type II toxin-antitoxin system PemK/MazF family toxin [Methylovulum miyakonense]|uniref:type II toxin-antitoxin system PemK/MazF family toxin n=1 Tax=Methylovulum miyakonense TaxID=645578 RepID=UPI003BB71758